MSPGLAIAFGGGWFVLSLYLLFARWAPQRYNYFSRRWEADISPVVVMVVLFFSMIGLIGGPILVGRGLDVLFGG